MSKHPTPKLPPALAAVLPSPRADVAAYALREDRTPRRKQRAEVYSTEDTRPPRKVLRVVSERYLEDYLGPAAYSALVGIRAAFQRLTAGMGVGAASYESRYRPGPWSPHAAAAREAGLADRWIRWAQVCSGEGLHLAAIIEIVIEGNTPASTDRKWRKRNGWSVGAVKRAAELWLSPRVRLAFNVRKGPR